MNEQLNNIKIRRMDIATPRPQITQNSRLVRSPKQNLFTATAAPNCFVRPCDGARQSTTKCFYNAHRDGAEVGRCRVRPSTALGMVRVSCSTISMFVIKQSQRFHRHQVVQTQATNFSTAKPTEAQPAVGRGGTPDRKIQPHGLVDQAGKTVTDLQRQQRPKQIVHASHPLPE